MYINKTNFLIAYRKNEDIGLFKQLYITLSFRTLANYVYEEGAVTPVSTIIQHAKESQENYAGANGCALGFSSLGRIVKELWGDKVKNAKHRARTDRQPVHLNIKQIQPSKRNNNQQEDHITLAEQLVDVTVPEDWKMVQDKPNCISFVCLEKWEFQKRVSTAVVVSQTGDLTYLTLRTHGCETELPNVVLSSIPLVKRVGAVFDHIKNSTFCGGFRLPEGESLVATATDHLEGCFRNLTEDSAHENPIVVHFSSRCKIFSFRDGLCSECKNLLKAHTLKKQRKEKCSTIHSHCNKRYLTKEEMKVVLECEKNARLNAQQRELYWREKFAIV